MNGRPKAKPKELPDATEAATFDVEEAISHSLLYVQSTYKKSSTADKAAVIDGLIERLRSERDLITTQRAQRQECENTPLLQVPQEPERGDVRNLASGGSNGLVETFEGQRVT